MHEYSIQGHKKEKYLFYLSILSVSISTFITSLISRINSTYHLEIQLAVGSSLIFALLFFVSNNLLWRIAIFKIPNLNGKWICEGKSYKHGTEKVYDWSGEIKIAQSWNSIMITLRTGNSSSYSTSVIGGIERIAGTGYKLTYLYKNNPSSDNKELHEHSGLCELMFDDKLITGTGEYFNNKERGSYGSMRIKRSSK